jgi:hypothetical protein
MSDVVFIDPDDEGPLDPSKITRSADGRPRIRIACPNADRVEMFDSGGTKQMMRLCVEGRAPSAKRAGNTVQCPKCKGVGYKTKLYSRCTSFVGVLDDRSALEKWQKRIVLVGLATDTSRVDELKLVSPDDREVLDAFAAWAFEAGDGHEKARKGTDLHKLSEYVDQGEPLPAELWNEDAQAWRPVTLQDRADMAAYVRTRDELGLVYLDRELFVVNDEYAIGGTFDGLAGNYVLDGEHLCQKCDRPLIVDLKTGRTDYGQGKMAQQLAVYAHGSRYDPATGERTPLDACPHVGVIIALPQGTGEATVLLLDLERGWQAVQLSARVREYRREVGRGAYVIGGGAS